jgi:hypothetical protein
MPDGTLIPLRCGASNRCAYCSWLVALENALVVRADAAECLPQLGFTLTTRAAQTPAERFRRDVEQAMKALRREPWACDARYLGQIEHTTGHGTRSGGARRIHQHGLMKDVDRDRAADVAEVLRRVWLSRTGAHRVEAHELHRPAGAIAYLVNHHQKTAQAPPKGWSGKRFRPSKGYFERPIVQLREEARVLLRDRRVEAAIAATLEDAGAWDVIEDGPLMDEIVGAAVQRAAENPPELVRVQRIPTSFGDDDLPSAWETQVLGPVRDEDAPQAA